MSGTREPGFGHQVSVDPEKLGIAVEQALAEMESRMPTAEELAYIRNRMVQDQHAAWLVKWLRANAPWVLAIVSAAAAGLWFLLTHKVTVENSK